MRDSIFVVNAGSSSIKFQLFSVGDDDGLERRLKGQMDGIGSRPRLVAKGEDGKTLVDRTWQAGEVSGVPAALDKVVEFLREVSGGFPPPSATAWCTAGRTTAPRSRSMPTCSAASSS